jgi:hypothetical protein
MSSVKRPLNPKAIKAADADLYAAHEGDPRPNPLYDADGNKKKLSAKDPDQAGLRKEWVEAYERHGGETDEPDKQPENTPDEAIEPCPELKEEEDEPKPTITASWSKSEVVPIHNNAYPPATAPTDAIPEDSKVVMTVDTTLVPDGTAARIIVKHCVTDAIVPKGDITGLEVRSNKVVDKKTGTRPFFAWDAEKDPWEIWDKPFYYFQVAVTHKGLRTKTPKDFAGDPGSCCRVLYWTVTFADSTANLPGVLPESNNVRAAMNNGALKSRCDVNNTTGHTAQANLGSLIRNTYAFHEGSHGVVVDRKSHLPTNHWQSGNVNPPSLSYSGANGSLPVKAWQSVLAIGSHTPASVNGPATSQFPTGATWSADQIGDDQIKKKADYPSMPKVLFYCSCCVAGWEKSLGSAIVSRGCQNVIAFRKFIPDDAAAAMGKKVFDEWAKKKLDPSKVPDIFYQVGAPYYGSMRPVIFGLKAGAATSDDAKTVDRIKEGVDELINGAANAIASFFS